MSPTPSIDQSANRPKILYLTTLYPAASHTFIQREISALRELNMDICTASIRRPADEHMIGQAERDEREKTYYVLSKGAFWKTVKAHATLKLTSPVRYLRTIALALRSFRPGVKGIIKQIAYFAEAGIIARHMQKNGVTHLHNHFGDQSATVAMLASQLSGIPFSFTIHGPTELEDPLGWAMDKKIALSKFTVCISEYSRNLASRIANGQHDDKLYIIHCGVFPEVYQDAEPSASEGLKLVFVGRLDPIKGVPILFDALEVVHKARSDVTLDIVGGGSLKDELEARAKNIPGITFHGYLSQDEVAHRIEASDCLILPSFAEGLPVVYMEALASARPAIATDVAGVSELIVNNETGLLVEAGDSDQLAQAILTMANSPDKRREMGLAGRQRVAKEFNIREEAKRMKSLYIQETASSKRPSKFLE